jgi:hypothetical protein
MNAALLFAVPGTIALALVADALVLADWLWRFFLALNE